MVHAAHACVESGYSATDLKQIWWHEIAPLLTPNLLTLTGNWAGIDPDWLEARILERTPRITGRWIVRLSKTTWLEVCRLADRLAQWHEPTRTDVANVLHALVWHAYSDLYEPSDEVSLVETALLRRLWFEAASPLIKALYIQGQDAPLQTMLERGEQLIMRVR